MAATSNPPLSDTNSTVEDLEAISIEGFERVLELSRDTFRLLHQRNSERPAVKLLPELLSSIFEMFCWSTNGTETEKVRFISFSERLLVVCQTCSRWRDVAHSTSSLWSVISITERAGAPKDFMERLLRASNRPLTLFICDPYNFDELDDPKSESRKARSRLQHLLQPLADRLQTLNTDIWVWGNSRPQNIAPDLSCLSTLIFQCDASIQEYDCVALPTGTMDLTRATQLMDASIVCSCFHHDGGEGSLRVQVPTSFTVKDLTLCGVETQSAIDAINSCYQLEHLQWDVYGDELYMALREDIWDAGGVTLAHVTMANIQQMKYQPQLTSLQLCGDVPILLMGHVSAPNLLSLELSGLSDDSGWLVLDHPLSNPSLFPSLRELTVGAHPKGRPIDVVPFLLGHHLLETLNLGFHLTTALVECLGTLSDLTSLSVSVELLGRRCYNFGPVEDMLRLWMASPPPPRSLTLPASARRVPEALALSTKYPGMIT